MTKIYKIIKSPSINPKGEDGKVIRSGKNLSGNKPFQPKRYVLKSLPTEVQLMNCPNQMRLILKWMFQHPTPMTGNEIISAMISEGAIKTKIDPPVLFAYYRKAMTGLGLTEV